VSGKKPWLGVMIATALFAPGCPSAPAPRPTTTAKPLPPSAPAKVAAANGPLPFIEDDYPRALAEARAKHLPLFVDAWATWCHTCMSMRSFVFTDDVIKAKRDAFVWLAIDTERPENAVFVKQFPIDSLPTLFVIDPASETPTLRWLGSLTAPELVSLLDETPDTGASAVAFVRGNQASARGDARGAIAAYRDALKAAPEAWAKRATVVDMLLSRLAETKDHAACAELASDEVPKLSAGTSRLNVAAGGTGCALELPKGAPARARLAPLVGELKRMLADPALPVLADDRSAAFEELVYALKSEGEPAEAKKAAGAWAAFLEDEAKKAPNAAARAVFDPHRLSAYLELGEVARALPMLSESERDFPDDYNPPARIARANFELKRYPDALAASARARQKAYGPRKLKIYLLTADILATQGDLESEKEMLREALTYAKTIPLREGYEKLRVDLERRLQSLSKPPSAGAARLRN
jgi:thioredoxin-like negative regulator of GroEL